MRHSRYSSSSADHCASLAATWRLICSPTSPATAPCSTTKIPLGLSRSSPTVFATRRRFARRLKTTATHTVSSLVSLSPAWTCGLRGLFGISLITHRRAPSLMRLLSTIKPESAWSQRRMGQRGSVTTSTCPRPPL